MHAVNMHSKIIAVCYNYGRVIHNRILEKIHFSKDLPSQYNVFDRSA